MYYFATVPSIGDLYVEKVLLSKNGTEILFVAKDECGSRYLGACTADCVDIRLNSWVFAPVDADDILALVCGRISCRAFFDRKGGFLLSYTEELGIYTKTEPCGMPVSLLPEYRIDIDQIKHDREFMETLAGEAQHTYHIEDDGTVMSGLYTDDFGYLSFTGKVGDREYLCTDEEGTSYYVEIAPTGQRLICCLDEEDGVADGKRPFTHQKQCTDIPAKELSVHEQKNIQK